MSRRDRLQARQPPTVAVTLAPTEDGAEPEVVELRAIPPNEFEALADEHPPTAEQEARGAAWNSATFRPALLEACVITPDGEDPLTAADWADAAASGWMTIGELNSLFDCALELNAGRWPSARTGKG